MQATFIIRDLDTLRVVADPLRAQLIEIIIQQPLTIRQAAEKLGLAPSKLYYHFNLLEKHGLIRVDETRQVANLLEKVFAAVAPNVEMDDSLLNFATREGKESIHAVMTSAIDTTREDLIRSLQARDLALERGAAAQPRRAIVTRVLSRIPEARADAFCDQVTALLREFEAADAPEDSADPALQTYAFTIAFYPSFYFNEPDDESSQGAAS